MAVILVTAQEASEHFKIHRATFYRWVKDGKLRWVFIGSKRYLVYDHVERLVGAPI